MDIENRVHFLYVQRRENTRDIYRITASLDCITESYLSIDQM